MAYKPADKEMLTMIADEPITFSVNGFSGSIIFQTDGDIIRILMTQPVPDRNPLPATHNPLVPVVHQPTSAPVARKEFISRILREPPPLQQTKRTDATLSTEVPKSVRFALPQESASRSQKAQHQEARASSPESPDSSGFSKKSASVETRPSPRIRFDIRKNGNSWDVYNGDVMIEYSKFKKLSTHPDEQTLRFLFEKKEALMVIYVNSGGEYFLKHGDKGNTDWYKYKNN